MLQTLLQELVNVVELGLEQRLLHVEEGGQHAVVDIHNEVEVAGLLPVRLVLGVDGHCALGHLDLEHSEVLDLPQQAHEGGVEVDPQVRVLLVLLAAEQVLLELLGTGALLLEAPVVHMLHLKVAQRRHDRRVRPHNLLALLRLEHRLAHTLEAIHGVLHPLHQPAAPRHCAGVGGGVVGDGGVVLAEDEDLLDCLEVLGIGVEEVGVLLLQVREDNLPLEESLKRVEELEAAEHRRAVVKGLHNDGREAPLELVDVATKGVEVVIKLLVLDVHDIVGGILEDSRGIEELGVDLLHRRREGLALGAAHLDLLELGELHDGLHEVEDVVAPLEKGVEA
mmetsp:Transcript_27983/g.68378  ORF Transcript_27983/g.68378 Transcript_27983/m.68378 type:complete len:337 (+) Transcript_27983:2342-3352(+)